MRYLLVILILTASCKKNDCYYCTGVQTAGGRFEHSDTWDLCGEYVPDVRAYEDRYFSSYQERRGSTYVNVVYKVDCK